MEYLDDFLLVVDSTGFVTLMDTVNDRSLCTYNMEGSIECLSISGSIISMLVDGHMARLRLNKGSGPLKKVDQNDFVQDLWRALHNSLGCGSVFSYLGLSVHERIQWGLEASLLPPQCTIL